MCVTQIHLNLQLLFQSSKIEKLQRIAFKKLFFPVNLPLSFALKLEDIHKAVQF